MSIGIFYGSNGGATESIAEQIRNAMDLEADLHDILFELYGMNQSSVSRLLRTLVKEELLTSPSPGYYRRKG